MDTPVVKILAVVAGVVAMVIVTFIVLNLVNNTGNNIDTDGDIIYDYGSITNESLCDAVGGAWNNGTCEG